MKHHPSQSIYIAAVLFFLVSGCAANAKPHPKNPPYSLGFYNATATQIDDVVVDYVHASGERYRGGCGVISAGATKRSHHEPDPIPVKVTLTWRTADNVEHKKELAIAERVKNTKSFEGTIWIKFAENDVTVVPMTRSEMRDKATRQQHPRPD